MRETTTHDVRGEHLSDEEIALFVDALTLETVEQLPGDMREHVAGCHTCKGEITGLFALLNGHDDAPVHSHPFFALTPRRKVSGGFPILRVAAAVATIAVLAVLTYYIASMMSTRAPVRLSEERTGQSVDSVRKGEDNTSRMNHGENVDLAANLAVNADLEDLVSSQSRSEDFEVFSPVNGAVITSRQAFTWRGIGGEPLNLSLIDNKGKVVLMARVSGTTYVLTRVLPPGLYYWKVQSQSELLYVGKFLIILPSKRTPPT